MNRGKDIGPKFLSIAAKGELLVRKRRGKRIAREGRFCRVNVGKIVFTPKKKKDERSTGSRKLGD